MTWTKPAPLLGLRPALVELQWLESFPIGAKAINGLFVRENVRSAQTMRSLEQTTGSFSKGRGDRYLNGVIHSGRLT